MWRFVILGVVVIGVAVLGFSLVDGGDSDVSATALIAVPETGTDGYARATEPRDWQFPRDYGAHPEYQTEWWYYTGNLADESGRRFGYQFTIFRRAIAPQAVNTASEWRSNQVYMAHFTVSDIAGEEFYHAERYSRGGAELAGALPNDMQPDAPYQVWLEGWQVVADANADQYTITADAGDFTVNLALEQVKPVVLQGDDGLSQKSLEPGNASYYYSMPRLATQGIVTIDGEGFTVTGETWMDHEFSTSALSADARGWDWFGLIFEDGYELMLGQIRLTDSRQAPFFAGLLNTPDGAVVLPPGAFTISPTDTWISPHTGAEYPSGWEVVIDQDAAGTDADIRLDITPLMKDQELYGGDIAYWEGAVQVEGTFSGYGYAELTGYAAAITGRF